MKTETKSAKTSAPSDDVIRKAQQGDQEAFAEIYQFYRPRVLNTCRKFSYQDAEDLSQQAFIQLFRKISSFQFKSSFSTWLTRVTINICLMYLRAVKSGGRDISLCEAAYEKDGAIIPLEECIAAKTDISFEKLPEMVDIERAVSHLPPGYRIQIMLKFFEGLEHNEIAELLGCSIGNSKSQTHKAVQSLKRQLHANCA